MYGYSATTGAPTIFNNCTFKRNNTYSYPIIQLVAGNYHPYQFINCTFTENGAPYSYGIYNGYYYPHICPIFAGYTRNGSALANTDFGNVYVGSTFILGSVINPTVKNGSSVVEGAVVSITPQIRFNDNINIGYQQGYGEIYSASMYLRQILSPFNNVFGTYVTNSSGQVKDELGNSVLIMPDKAYTGTDETLTLYFGGSGTTVRAQTDTTWTNDGTDEGCIIMASHPDYGGKMVVVNPNTTYTDDMDISLGSAGNHNFSKVVKFG